MHPSQARIMARNHITVPAMLALLLAIVAGGCGTKAGDAPRAGTPGKPDTAWMIVMRDAQNEDVRLAHPAGRVISLAPSITEIVFAIGGGPNLIGRTSFCDYPPAALAVPAMGDMLTLKYESIIAARPDLILMTHAGNIKSNYEKLRDLGFMVCAIIDTNVAAVIGAIDTIGILMGRRNQALALGARLRHEIDSIGTLAASTPRVPMFVVIDKSPLITVSSGFVAEELAMAGADNIAAGGITAYPKFSREELLRRDPAVILIPGTSWNAVDEMLQFYPEWKNLRAVRDNHVYVLPSDIIFRPGPRIGQSIGFLYRALHGANAKALFNEAMANGGGSGM